MWRRSIATKSGRVVPFGEIQGPGYWFLVDLARDVKGAYDKLYANYKENKVVKVKDITLEDMVVLFDVEDMRHVLLNEGKFPTGTVGEFRPVLDWGRKRLGQDAIGLSLFTHGERWKDAKSIFQAGASLQASNLYSRQLNAAARSAVSFFPEYVANREIKRWAQLASFDMFCSVMFGASTESSNPKGPKESRELVDLDERALGLGIRLALLPSFIQGRNTWNEFEQSMDRMLELATPLVDRVWEADSSVERSWFRDLKEERGLSREELVSAVPPLLFASVGTTHASILWLLLNLVNFPDKQARLAQEILENVPPEGYSRDLKLPFLEAFIRETNRFTPAAIAPSLRRLQHDIVLPSGYHIPAGKKLVLCPILHAQDKDLVRNADQFLPERYMKEEPEHAACPRSAELLGNRLTKDSFGVGARMCLGKRVAELELRTLLCTLVSQYELYATTPNQPYKVEVGTMLFPHPFPKIQLRPRS